MSGEIKKTDYNSEILPLQNAIENISDSEKKNEAEKKLAKLRNEIVSWKTREETLKEIENLKKEYISKNENNAEKNLSPAIKEMKNKIEKQSKEPLNASRLSEIIKELPADNLSRSYILQYVFGKIISEWYDVYIDKKWVKIISKNKSLEKNAISLEDTLNNHIESKLLTKKDIEKVLLIRSWWLEEYSATFWWKIPENIDNKDYVKKIMQINNISEDATVEQISSNNRISKNEKALIISYLNWWISWDNINSTMESYNEMKKNNLEIFNSEEFNKINSKLSSDKTPVDAKDLAKKVTEDPTVLLSKPMTAIAAGLAVLFGIGYEKWKWFSLWTWLKRWFIWLFALLIGSWIAKEWWMDPKKLLKEWMDLMKEGSDKAKEEWQKALNTAKWAIKDWEKNKKEDEENEKLSYSQSQASEKVKWDWKLILNVNKFSEKNEKKWKIEDYLKFINSQKFQTISINKLFYPEIKENWFFSNHNSIDSSIDIDKNLDPLILKQVLRVYLWLDYKFGLAKEWKKPWDAEFALFESKYLPKKKEENKSFIDLLNKIYSK